MRSASTSSGFQRWLAVSCLFLMLFAFCIETVHLHASNASAANSAPCVLCVSAHSTAPATLVVALPVLLAVESVDASLSHTQVFESFPLSLFIRPPPALG